MGNPVEIRIMGRSMLPLLHTSCKKNKFVCDWLSHFWNSEFPLTDQSCSGWPSTSQMGENIVRIYEMVLKDCHKTNWWIWFGCSGIPVNRFWTRNCKWKALQQNSCLACCWLIKSIPKWLCVVNWKNAWKLTLTFFDGHYWW